MIKPKLPEGLLELRTKHTQAVTFFSDAYHEAEKALNGPVVNESLGDHNLEMIYRKLAEAMPVGRSMTALIDKYGAGSFTNLMQLTSDGFSSANRQLRETINQNVRNFASAGASDVKQLEKEHGIELHGYLSLIAIAEGLASAVHISE